MYLERWICGNWQASRGNLCVCVDMWVYMCEKRQGNEGKKKENNVFLAHIVESVIFVVDATNHHMFVFSFIVS